VIGDTVNLAQRLEAANKDTGTHILLGPDTAEAVHKTHPLRALGEFALKGLQRKIPLYTPEP
jgi:class 3 adenylate cyclase